MRCRVLKRTAAGACLLMVAFMVCSCGLGSSEEAENPEKTMEALYQLVVCQDISEITKLGIDQAEAQETLDEYRKMLIFQSLNHRLHIFCMISADLL